MDMRRLGAVAGMGVVLFLLCSSSTPAVTDIMEGAEIRADSDAVKAILAAFDRTEEALRNESLSGIMAIYSKNYRHRGLRKEDTARIWEDIFARYDQFSSRHFFSKIVVEQKMLGKATAQVTCTGALFGVSVLKEKRGKPFPTAQTEAPVHIDVWFDAIHYLVLEDGTWKIIGHDPAGGEEDPFGAAIHLLF
jgi:hypothetical protein